MNILLWPFRALWSLIGFIFSLTGRILAVVLSLVLLILGGLLTITIAGAVVGIPLLFLGVLIMVKAVLN